MKPDEREFLLAVYHKAEGDFVRDIINRGSINYKRCWYLLEKWAGKGWYDSGVSLDLGWLTEAGKREAEKLL